MKLIMSTNSSIDTLAMGPSMGQLRLLRFDHRLLQDQATWAMILEGTL
jgi:hypothetical protein